MASTTRDSLDGIDYELVRSTHDILVLLRYAESGECGDSKEDWQDAMRALDEVQHADEALRRAVQAISSHRQSRWYEEGPLKGPSVEAPLALVPILVEVLSLTKRPLAPGVLSPHSLGDPLHVGSTRPLRTGLSSCSSLPSSRGAVADPRREWQSL
jgi:hypothetical protein